MDEPKGQDAFDFKLNVLMKEMDLANQIIVNFDSFAQASKNWAITLWAGAIALLLSKDAGQLRQFLFFTPVIPLVFWFLDAHWRLLQRRTIYRKDRIGEFLNSASFTSAFKARDFGDFRLWDPTGHFHRDEPDYKTFVSRRKTAWFPEVAAIYLTLIVTSVVIGLLFSA